MTEAKTAAQLALRAYAEATKGARCPICNGTESCDDTVRERLLADLGVSLNATGAAYGIHSLDFERGMEFSEELRERDAEVQRRWEATGAAS